MPTDLQRFDEEIAAIRSQLADTPSESSDRVWLLAEIAKVLAARFEVSNDLADLDASIGTLRDVLAGLPPQHPDRAWLSRLLATSLQTRFARTGDPADRAAADALAAAAAEPDRLRFAEEAPAGPPAPRQERSVVADERWGAAPPAADEPAPGAAPPAAKPAAPPPPQAAPPPPPPPPLQAAPPPAPPPPPAVQPPGPLPAVGGMPRRREGQPEPGEPATETFAAQPPAAAPRPAAPPPAAAPPAGFAGPPRTAAASGYGRTQEDRRLEFAAAYRRTVERGRRHPFLFYVHRPADRDQVRALIERRAPMLGGQPSVGQGAAARAVRSGTTLTIVPNVLGATFEPSQMEVVAGDSVREVTFQVSVARETPAGSIDGYVDIFLGPLIIGQVPVAFEIEAQAAPVPSQPGVAELLEVANASIFDRIFISYSHKDSAVVDLCVATYQGLGVNVLLDRLDLRAGDEWRAVLTRMINDADVFQLYWSVAAAASNEVNHEWRLALELSKSRARSFIRPLYWETPMPPLPQALGHLHFSKLDLKRLRRAAKAYVPAEPGLLRRTLAALRIG